LRHEGADQKEIAQAVGRCPSTICRELRRNHTDGDYYAAQAQREAERRRRERPLTRKMENPEINEAVRTGLAHEWAPEQISGRMAQQGSTRRVSPQTIYAWIKQDEDRKHWESMLRRRGKRPSNGLTRQYFPKGTDFRDISHYEVRLVEKLLNNRPRACLGFRTPAEVFFEKNSPAGCD
jgi:IS30 family transposase